MFRCDDTCEGIFATRAKLNREEACYSRAKEKDDVQRAQRVADKLEMTRRYVRLIETWPPAEKLAIHPAVFIDRLRPEPRKQTIMKAVERVMETGLSPIDGRPIGVKGVTKPMIEYLIAKNDGTMFVPVKRIRMTQTFCENVAKLKRLTKDPWLQSFLEGLMRV